MRLNFIVFLLIVPTSLWTQQQASVETEKTLQLCSALTAPHCATPPRLRGRHETKLPGDSPQQEEVVILDLVVGIDGATHEIELVQSAEQEFNQAVIAAVRGWKFEPGTYDGKPVAAEVRIRFVFHTTGEPTVQMGSTLVSWASQEQVEKRFAEANQALNRRDYPAAVAAARQVIAMVPLATRIRITLGMSLLELDQFDEAQAALQDEIRLDPASPYAYDRLGAIYWRQHKYDDAIAEFQKQIIVTPQGYDAHANLGVLLCGRKRCKEAMPELDKALAMSPNQSRVLMAHGECNVDLGNTAKGVQGVEQATNPVQPTLGTKPPTDWRSEMSSWKGRRLVLKPL